MQKSFVNLLFLILIITFSLSAQELPKASKMENPNWKGILLINVEPGSWMKVDSIMEKFMKAGEKAGTNTPTVYEFRTGSWSHMILWDLESIDELNWTVSPDDEKWWAALAELEGGAEAAFKLWGEWMDLIENSNYELALKKY